MKLIQINNEFKGHDINRYCIFYTIQHHLKLQLTFWKKIIITLKSAKLDSSIKCKLTKSLTRLNWKLPRISWISQTKTTKIIVRCSLGTKSKERSKLCTNWAYTRRRGKNARTIWFVYFSCTWKRRLEETNSTTTIWSLPIIYGKWSQTKQFLWSIH